MSFISVEEIEAAIKYKDNFDDDGKGIWFMCDALTGELLDSFKDPDIETIDAMCRNAEMLGDEFFVVRLSEDSIERLYYKYVQNKTGIS